MTLMQIGLFQIEFVVPKGNLLYYMNHQKKRIREDKIFTLYTDTYF